MTEARAAPQPHDATGSRGTLAARLRDGDPGAFEDLFHEVGRRAFALAYRVLQDPRLAEDVVQDAFLWLWEHNDRIDPRRGSVEALLMTLVHRRAVDAGRGRSRRNRRTSAFTDAVADEIDRRAAILLDGSGPAVSPARVRAALEQLPRDQRQVVEMAFYDGCTQSEVAQRLDLPLGTVKSRIRLAMGKLRATLGLEVRT